MRISGSGLIKIGSLGTLHVFGSVEPYASVGGGLVLSICSFGREH